ncbi:MAG: exosome complex protein Rrp42 [Candidatus Pacearchaeota archaeon]|nr:exosome complex protein Rrp42 [Nanoarchaeota archaeon]MDZ4226547.1 exosome complex protein Rrp42 [Candidatus Pacearchaeota archaeon]
METSKVTGQRISEYLSQGKRFDGRGAWDFRDISIETGVSKRAEGSAKVRIGKTEVIVGVKMDVTEPYPDSPDRGNLIVSAELLPLSSERFESGPPRFPAIEIGRLTDRAIRESKFIEMEKLCIKEGEKVWVVYIDIYSLNDDGNLIDAATLGAVAALKNARMPKYDEENGKVVYGEFTDKKIPVAKEPPIVITAHKIGNSWIVDPTLEEEDVSEARVTIGATPEGIISSIQKGESREIDIEEFENVLDTTEKVRKKVFSSIENSLK